MVNVGVMVGVVVNVGVIVEVGVSVTVNVGVEACSAGMKTANDKSKQNKKPNSLCIRSPQ